MAADCTAADYIIVHEFGHHLAGLGDEYYVSNVAYETGKLPRFEPWEPNITALLDTECPEVEGSGRPRHADAHTVGERSVRSGGSAQTAAAPEQATAGGATAESPDAPHEARLRRAEILQASPYAGRVGAFEGASYEVKGLYRPAVDCVMFSRNPVGFCPVCRRAIERVIDQQTDRGPVGQYIPAPQPVATKLLVGAHHCPLWEADKPQMWDNVVKHPERTPTLGFYAQENPEVSDWETKWAVEHGVSFFVYCWYRASQGKPVEMRFGSAIHDALFKAKFTDKIKFTIMWENQSRGTSGVADEQDLMQNLLPFWIENYFRHPSYLKVDNKPLLFIYRPEFLIEDLGSVENVAQRSTACVMRARRLASMGSTSWANTAAWMPIT